MDAADEVIDAALDAAGGLPSPAAYRAWCRAYRAGQLEEEEGPRPSGGAPDPHAVTRLETDSSLRPPDRYGS